ncbi:hypothetical protein JG687_00010460 [Phytophthora cactorum]|uniref:Uncharacterized protein n=1 Tax=Phytophthora cactorum TaxID=29920 RepID=A0A329T0P9_9STRA|nr:hypothetical protein PC117_g13866 [Phytophthora cactorum]KAG2996525.1 hypothetical protein PC120_g21478 [Phytophthora cactorum]KAG3147702.1 hypothetical protein C6341_g17646 [Phytophthora cactorum]KAG6956665.1 hypothetical protein JG687_00010460 [Phytophthora cactorum]RAW42391.1 hypothetical protein PC110_g1395 [Phytophthora cactorum]
MDLQGREMAREGKNARIEAVVARLGRELQQTVAAPAVRDDDSGWILKITISSAEQEAGGALITGVEETAVHTVGKVGKATGLYLLGNDWYRAYQTYLVPIFVILLNRWYTEGVVPKSFSRPTYFA